MVFDGYTQGASTKDMAHAQRRRNIPGRDVYFEPDMQLSEKKEDFLANVQNKQKFIDLVGTQMKKAGIVVVHAEGDADCLIANEALKSAKEHATHVVGEDTDLLVLLLHHVQQDMNRVYFSSSKAGTTRVWDIKKTQANLGPDVCKSILFAHAFSGCDTTSCPFGVGKAALVKNIQQGKKDLINGAKVFLQTSDHEAVAHAGERLMASLFKAGSEEDTLDQLRLVKCRDKVATGTKQVEPKSLPPTSAAAKQHSYRVYHQVQEWACLGVGMKIKAQDWGFHIQQGQMMPVPTDLPPAPDELLNTVKCGCTTDCSSKGSCSCRRFGLAVQQLVQGAVESAA